MSTSLRQKIAQLEDALYSGASSVTIDGVTTTFRSQAELKESIAELKRRVGQRPARRRTASVYMGHR